MNTFVIRLFTCFILSILIGIERQLRHRMVGLRTNVLVCVGAFLFVYLSFGINDRDLTRIAAQVVSGIGFLGAGVILRDGNKIKGLNTAATLWCVAAIGVLCSAGLLLEAMLGTVFVLISNIVLRLLSMFIMNKVKALEKEMYTIIITCNSNKEKQVRAYLMRTINNYNFVFNELEKNEITNNNIKLRGIIITEGNNKIETIINKISMHNEITSIKWEHDKYNGQNYEDDEES